MVGNGRHQEEGFKQLNNASGEGGERWLLEIPLWCKKIFIEFDKRDRKDAE